MKKIKALIIMLTAAAALTGCGRESIVKKADAIENPNRFRVEAGGNMIGVALVTDRETGIQYLMNTYEGGFIMLVDKDGNPYIANGWRDYAP